MYWMPSASLWVKKKKKSAPRAHIELAKTPQNCWNEAYRFLTVVLAQNFHIVRCIALLGGFYFQQPELIARMYSLGMVIKKLVTGRDFICLILTIPHHYRFKYSSKHVPASKALTWLLTKIMTWLFVCSMFIFLCFRLARPRTVFLLMLNSFIGATCTNTSFGSYCCTAFFVILLL